MKEKNKYTKTINWKQFYRNVFALVIPIAIQNLINVGVTATDVIMLGKVGEKGNYYITYRWLTAL